MFLMHNNVIFFFYYMSVPFDVPVCVKSSGLQVLAEDCSIKQKNLLFKGPRLSKVLCSVSALCIQMYQITCPYFITSGYVWIFLSFLFLTFLLFKNIEQENKTFLLYTLHLSFSPPVLSPSCTSCYTLNMRKTSHVRVVNSVTSRSKFANPIKVCGGRTLLFNSGHLQS